MLVGICQRFILYKATLQSTSNCIEMVPGWIHLPPGSNRINTGGAPYFDTSIWGLTDEGSHLSGRPAHRVDHIDIGARVQHHSGDVTFSWEPRANVGVGHQCSVIRVSFILLFMNISTHSCFTEDVEDLTSRSSKGDLELTKEVGHVPKKGAKTYQTGRRTWGRCSRTCAGCSSRRPRGAAAAHTCGPSPCTQRALRGSCQTAWTKRENRTLLYGSALKWMIWIYNHRCAFSLQAKGRIAWDDEHAVVFLTFNVVNCTTLLLLWSCCVWYDRPLEPQRLCK